MVIHYCMECARISINRIAADDNAELLFGLFENSLVLGEDTRKILMEGGIQVLDEQEHPMVRRQLFGSMAPAVR